jgi:endonuclease III
MPVTTINKQRLLTTFFTVLKKHFGDQPIPADRPVLEQMVYAVLREGATRKEADKAFDRLGKTFFDWNEIRVSSVHEVEDALAGLPDAGPKAQRLVELLQEVFESTFSYDLDGLAKKGLKQAAKQIGRYQAVNEYAVSWVTQRSLGGHAIPVDPPTLRTVVRLGLTEEETKPDAVRTSLEHQVPKAKGPQFTEYVSLLAREFCWEDEPNCGPCPMKGECLTGTTDPKCQGGGSRRPKPR